MQKVESRHFQLNRGQSLVILLVPAIAPVLLPSMGAIFLHPKQAYNFVQDFMLATLSPERQIKNRLRELGCSENEFAMINPFCGRTRQYEALRGVPGQHFNREEAERMLTLIGEMESLQRDVEVPVRWSEKERIEIALVLRRIKSIANETDGHSYDDRADEATRQVRFNNRS